MRRLFQLVLLTLALIALASGAKGKKRGGKKKVPAASPPPPDADTMAAMRHHQRGVMAHVQGDPKGAVAAFERAIDAKPDFAYAYYRMGFVIEEQRKAKEQRKMKESPAATSPTAPDALPIFRAALRIDPSDEMVHMALGQALQDRSRLDEAAATYKGITTALNPRSAVAYWALGKVRAAGIDEFDSDPEDPNDPSHCYEQAAQLQPDEFRPDGTRFRKMEPMTPEREEREEAEARERRQQVLKEWQDGTRSMNVAGDEESWTGNRPRGDKGEL
jgi:tetratricopeptide (TPR) repeat protein